MSAKIIVLRIPESKRLTAFEGFLAIYPNSETIPNPDWVDPEDGTEAPEIVKFTDSQWVSEQIRRLIVRDIYRGNQMLALEAVNGAIDDSLVEIQGSD